jgi:hypothetical protein
LHSEHPAAKYISSIENNDSIPVAAAQSLISSTPYTNIKSVFLVYHLMNEKTIRSTMLHFLLKLAGALLARLIAEVTINPCEREGSVPVLVLFVFIALPTQTIIPV